MSVPIATTKISQDFTISETGEGYISQREVARLAGVHHSKIQRAVQKLSGALLRANTNENKQLSGALAYDLLLDCAEDGNMQALKSLRAIGQAGMRAYIYSAAGYVQPQLDPYADLRKISIPEQWVYEGFPGRKCGSLHKTMMEGYHRSRGTPLHDQVVYDGGMLRFSPMFLLSIQFAKQDGFAFKAFVCSVLGTDALPAPETILTVSFDGDAVGVIV